MPSQDDIEGFLAFSGCYDRELATKFINDANGDLNNAVSNYFDNPKKFDNWNTSYDESAFHADRYGDTQSTNVPSFAIHAPDDTDFSFTHSSAPTRPPSPAAASGLQESGTIGGGAHFGPATRDAYDLTQWALTTTAGTATEIWPDVDPPRRARVALDPGFLKPSSSADFLPALITILHTVPKAAEILLGRGVLATDYGEDTNWWSGSPIKLPVTIDAGADEVQLQRVHRLDFLHEIQRLMTGLIYSKRAYLSVDALMATHQMEHQDFPDQVIKTQTAHFLANWDDVAENLLRDSKAQRLFRTEIRNSQPDKPSEELCFFQFDLSVSHVEDRTPTLYESMDDAFWGGDPDGTSKDQIWIEEAGDVLVFNVKQEMKRNLNVDVPARLYLDRYLQENVAAMKEARQQIADCNRQLRILDDRRQKLRNFINPTGSSKSSKVEDLLKTALHQLEARSQVVTSNSDRDERMTSSPVNDPGGIALIEMLHKLGSRVQGQLEELQRQSKQTQDTLRGLNTLLKDIPDSQIDSSGAAPEAVYILHGVATDASTTYFRVPSPSMPDIATWCSVAYFSNPNFSVTEKSEDDVLRAVKTESENSVLLVYIRESMDAPVESALPDALKTFVERDNALFDQELEEYNRQHSHVEFTNYTPGDPPPYDAGLNGSNDSFVADPGENVVSTQEYASQRQMLHDYDSKVTHADQKAGFGPANG